MLDKPPSSAARRAGFRWLLLGVLLLAGCRADQATKAWAQGSFQERPVTVVPRVLELRYAENRAIAFSMLRGIPEARRTPLIFGMTSLALLALLSVIWTMRRQSAARLVPLCLILAGALGNLQDRWSRGYVIDFVHVHWGDRWSFPIFNLADSLISVGVCLLFFAFLSRPAPRDTSLGSY